MELAFVVAVIAWLALLIVEYMAANRLRAYRRDIPADAPPWRGASWIPQVNVSSSANYTTEGQRKLRWFKALAIGRLILGAVCVGLFALAFVL